MADASSDPSHDEQNDDDNKPGWFSRASFAVKYTLYTSTPVGRWFHSKQLRKWKETKQAKPHCTVPPQSWDDVIVKTIPLISDNYCYLIIDQSCNAAVVVDPCDAETVLAEVEKTGVNLVAILSTHGHHDHSFGNKDLKSAIPNLRVFGTGEDKVPCVTDELPMDREVSFTIGALKWISIPFPGHTKGHVIFKLLSPATASTGDVTDLSQTKRQQPILFSGDGIFVAGTGRVFEGTMEEMYNSLTKLRNSVDYPDGCLLFPGHEYSFVNLMFAYKVDGKNDKVIAQLKASVKAKKEGIGLIPVTLEQERSYNPFLRLEKFVEEGDRDFGVESQVEKEVKACSYLRGLKDYYAPSSAEYAAMLEATGLQ